MSKGRAEAAAGAPRILLRYLQEQNRPYSAQDVFGNLQREHGLGKAAVVKALEQLAQQGKIKEKMYGKQKIYFADQDQFDTVSDADLQSLDAKIVALTAKVQSLQQSCRHMEAERDPGVEEGVCQLHRETEEHQSSHQPCDSRRERTSIQREAEVLQGVEKAEENGRQQTCMMQSLKATPRARSNSLKKLG
ncbi:PREDICTED: homologous-pairing protein 2 homolog isoform X2 [Condylura cristata]|uniref:homologous-pairing protein 2 homolog isoform X2 n=1 Tax=Condylura cristata TaxID=143302 RepID=UPI000642EFC4|nr:PREDICTED: homologous-pairing protein 2 homolog isoform X2 [Condylura cristata]